jgi:hypothetical protein
MRVTSVDTQKTTMDLPVTKDCLENQINATLKNVSGINPGPIQNK